MDNVTDMKSTEVTDEKNEERLVGKTGVPLSDFKKSYAEQLPREKLIKLGARNLETAELIAIMLRTGTVGKNVMVLAHEMLEQFGGSLINMSSMTVGGMTKKFSGLGTAKAVEILAALELGRRISKEEFHRRKIMSAEDAYEV